MSTRHLSWFFSPRSVALIGASATPSSVGATVLANLLAAGFPGAVWPVNPKYATLLDRTCYPDIEHLPGAPDLAVIATPAATVPDLIDRLGRRGTRAAVVLSAGFSELGTAAGAALRQAMLDAARPHLLRIIGPNTVGILQPGIRLNASFAHLSPRPGNIAFVTQSGALLTSVMDWAHSRNIGFSRLIALGSMSDVDFGDMLDELAEDEATRAILLYIEAVKQPRKFLSAARAAARNKPVIVCKSGRHPAGARAVASHTGALAGADAVYDCAFRRAGMLRVRSLEELFNAVSTLALVNPPEGDRLAIVTNGGGIGVLATDQLMDLEGHLAELSPGTLAALDAVLPPTWSHGNPLDVIGDATPKRYGDTLDIILSAAEVDATLALHVPVSVASPAEVADAVIAAHQRHPEHLLLTSWVGGDAVADARSRFAAARIPGYGTPEDAVRAFSQLVAYRKVQHALLQTPPAAPESLRVDGDMARELLSTALDAGDEWLDSTAARNLLTAYGIPILEGVACATPAAAGRAAADFGRPVALKIRSRDLQHKTEVGGVLLDLEGEEAVTAAAAAMAARIERDRPDARLDGFLVEPFYRTRNGHELIVGATTDPQFGPVILFGQGGTAVEVHADKALGLPPLNHVLAQEMIDRTRIGRLLAGYRQQPAADLEAVRSVLVRISQLMTDLPEIQELDINPLMADTDGVCALDVRVRIAPAAQPGSSRLAIRPYPDELCRTLLDAEGTTLLARPVRPDDAGLIQAFAARPDRPHIALPRPERLESPRFTQIDYDRELVLLLFDPKGRLQGIGVLQTDPDGLRADGGLAMARPLQRDVATTLLRLLIDEARTRGIATLAAPVGSDEALDRIFSSAGFDDAGLLRL
ncbi:MAG: acetate--CoA ligase family protein [Gammaproteobacteria bacterium]|nr:acetate--CoA ligase family protein [Gammaproteobacteria bacterium]